MQTRTSILTDDKIWRACAYVRLSREDGDKAESDSVVNQKALIQDFVKSQPQIELCLERIDDGYSGVDFNRDGFLTMMEDIKAGQIDCVIVKDLSRFGRNWIESGKYIEQVFPYLGVRFIAINDHFDSITAKNNNDNISLPFKNLINDAYAGDISCKIRSQLDTKRKNGDFIGAFATYGYAKKPDNRNKLVIDEFAAGVVRDIFKWRIEGLTNQGIANRLNELGLLSPYEYKRENGLRFSNSFKKNPKALWSAVSVGRILTNETYLGVIEQGKRTSKSHKVKARINKSKGEWVRVEDAHEPIISKQEFELVTELLKQDVRVAPGANELYIFSGMLKCVDCGQNMVRKIVPSGTNKLAYYVCGGHKANKNCSPHSISEKILTEVVLESIKVHIAAILEVDRVLAIADIVRLKQFDVQKLEIQIASKKAEIEKYRIRILKLYDDLKDGILEQDEYVSYKANFVKLHDKAKTALTLLNKELSELKNSRGTRFEWVEYFKQHRNIGSIDRGILVNLVSNIHIYEKNQIEICFKYQNSLNKAVRLIGVGHSSCDELLIHATGGA